MLTRASRYPWYLAAAAAVAAAASFTVIGEGCQVTCTSADDCGDKSFCALTSGACITATAIGQCKAIPESCPDIASPVCGCDGKAYANECEAARARVSIAATGDCTSACGGPGNAICGAGTYCHFDDGVCGTASALGTCEPIPTACDGASSGPVCGCDDQTYATRCDAEVAGVSVWLTTGCPCNAPFGDLACKDGEYCNFGTTGACLSADVTGACTPKPTTCTAVINYVCGCDGKTYDNECKAAQAGASVALSGSCPEANGSGGSSP